MLTRLGDPVVRFALRHAFGWMRLVPVVPAILIEFDSRAYGRLARLATFALSYAVPQAAAYLLEMEHDGRLDQMRLAGRRPGELAATALVSVSGPWLLIGLILAVAANQGGGATPAMLLAMAATAGIPTTLAALGMILPFARDRIDPRVGVAGLSVAAMAVGVIGGQNLLALSVFTRVLVTLLVVEAVVTGYCMSRMPRRIAHPYVQGDPARLRVHLPMWEWVLRWPGFYRGASLSASGLALALMFAPVVGIAWVMQTWYGERFVETAAIYLPPLFIGLIVISLVCREDAISGRLDLVRQSSTPVAVAAVEMLAGLWAPFVLATIVLGLATAILINITATGMLAGLAMIVALAPVPLVEGWSRVWPAMYALPYALSLWLTAPAAPLALSIVMWIAVTRMLRHPDRAVVAGWTGVVATSLVCAFVMVAGRMPDPFSRAGVLAFALLAISPVLIDARSTSRIDTWGQPLAVVVTVFLAVSFQIEWSSGAAVAVSVLAVWHAGRRLRQWNPSRPIEQAGARLVLLALVAMVPLLVSPSLHGPVRLPPGMLAGATALAAAVEAVHRIATFVARKRAAILPA